MPTPEQITRTVNGYLEAVARGATDDVVALYASDATVEDPVGSEVHIGTQAIRGFYSALAATGGAETEILTVRALGHEAAFHWALILRSGGIRIDIISVMTFDADAKITSMKAYWSPENITPL